MKFSFEETESFGIDISDLSLKIVKVNSSFELVSFAENSVAPKVCKKGEIQEENALAKDIREILLKVKGEELNTKRVICSLPEEKCFLDILRIPSVTDEEIESVVMREAEGSIPFPLLEVYFDFEKIIATNKESYQEVLVAASPKKVVDVYLRVLKKARLNAVAMEIESLAITRALIKKDVVMNPVLIIDFGANRSSFIIYSGTSIRFTSTIPVSSKELTQSLADKLKITFAQAEKLKKKHGLKGTKKIAEALKPPLDDLAGRIKNHLNYYNSHTPKYYKDKKLEKIILCGGGANLQGLGEFLTTKLKINVELGNALNNISQSNLKPDKALSFTTAIGLALRANYGH